MKTPAQDTVDYLVRTGVLPSIGGLGQWAGYVGREPLKPVDVVTVYDTGGGPNILVDLRVPSVQVRVRSNDYLSGWNKTNAIYQALVFPVYPLTEDGVTLQWMATSEIAYIGRNDADNVLFTCNFQLLRDGA